MATKSQLQVELTLDDKLSRQLRGVETKFQRFSAGFKKNWLAITAAVAGASVAIYAITSALKKAVAAADEVEGLRIRLEVLFGSVEEGNKVFRDMEELASRVPFTYQQIMNAATALGGVVRGGSAEIQRMMPMILDLSAATGISVQDVTSQMIRMYSAGAASADMFRERGVLAMLGFQAGVAVSAKETMKQVMVAWEEPQSKFRGATEKLAGTWAGAMSMIDDAFFKLKVSIGEYITQNNSFVDGATSSATAISALAIVMGDLRKQMEELEADAPATAFFDKMRDSIALTAIPLLGLRDTLQDIFNIGVGLAGQEPLPDFGADRAGGLASSEGGGEAGISAGEQEAVDWQAKIDAAITGDEMMKELEKASSDWRKQLRLDEKLFFIQTEIEQNQLLMQMSDVTQKQKEQLAAKNKKLRMAEASFEKKLQKQRMDSYLQASGMMLSAAATFFTAMGGETKKYGAIVKALRMGEVIVNTAAAVMNAMTMPPPANFVMAAATAAMGAAQLAVVASAPLATGTDTVPAMLTPGEMVIPRNFASAIRAGDISIGGAGGGGDVNINMESVNFSNEQDRDDFFEELNDIIIERKRAV